MKPINLIPLFLVTVLLSITENSWAAGLVATVNRQQMSEDETLNLTITLDDASFSGSPDLAGLETNFQIISQNSSSNTTIINGEYSSKKIWRYTLLPKKTGKVLIPSFKLKNQFSDAIEIDVLTHDVANKNNTGDANAVPSDLFIEQNIDKTEAYVQEPLKLTLRIFTAIQIARPEMPAPSLPGFMVEKLAEAEYQTKRNNRDYYVLEYKYLLFANKSGQVELPRQRYQISQIISNGPRSLFNIPEFSQPNTQARFLSTSAITLHIKAQPDNLAVAYWLPSEKIEITDNWPAQQSVEVGTALTRNITIKAQGNLASHIPPLTIEPAQGLKMYAEQPELDNARGSDTIIATRKENIAIVPAQAGTYILPPISLHWWDTKNNQFKTTTLPERTLTVTAVASHNNTTTDTTPTPLQASQSDNTPAENPAIDTDTTSVPVYMNAYVWMGATAVFGVLWLATFIAMTRKKNASTLTQDDVYTTVNTSQQPSLKHSLKQLKTACINNDAKQARTALIQWAASQWPDADIQTLQQVKQQVKDPAFGKLLDQLDASLYGSTEQWHGKTLLDTLASAKLAKANGDEATLPRLYD